MVGRTLVAVAAKSGDLRTESLDLLTQRTHEGA